MVFPQPWTPPDATRKAHPSLSADEAMYLARQYHNYLRHGERALMVMHARWDNSKPFAQQDAWVQNVNALVDRYYLLAWQYYTKLTTGAWKTA